CTGRPRLYTLPVVQTLVAASTVAGSSRFSAPRSSSAPQRCVIGAAAVSVIGPPVQDVNGLLDRPSSTGQPLLVHGQLCAAGVDRFSQAHDREVGQLLGDDPEPVGDLFELTRHG